MADAVEQSHELAKEVLDSGKKEFTMEVVSVDKMSLDKDLFEVPSDYKKLSMPNMQNMDKYMQH